MFCECEHDGYCNRYQREMAGRNRELCQGVNVDLGTAAAFRAAWASEAKTPPTTNNARHLLLKMDQAPGDAVAMTAAIYSLHRTHPGKYITSVESYWPEVFENNPDVFFNVMPLGEQRIENFNDVDTVCMHYPAIHQSNDRAIHFMQAWCEHLGSALGVSIPLACNRPQLYFDNVKPQLQRRYNYWIVCAGGKKDFTTKLWGHDNYQRVVSMLFGKVHFVQVGGSRPPVAWAEHMRGSQDDVGHDPLTGAEYVVGKTSLRDLFDIVRHARGVLCGVSLLMHVAAACEVPAVVIAGGREPVAWNAYPRQQYVHTVGALPCSSSQGHKGQACWRYRTVPLGDGAPMDNSACERPINGTPECMSMITPQEVANLILRYNNT